MLKSSNINFQPFKQENRVDWTFLRSANRLMKCFAFCKQEKSGKKPISPIVRTPANDRLMRATRSNDGYQTIE